MRLLVAEVELTTLELETSYAIIEQQRWAAIEAGRTTCASPTSSKACADVESYARLFPRSELSEAARSLLDAARPTLLALADEELWKSIDLEDCRKPSTEDSCDGVSSYLATHPAGIHAQEATALVQDFQAWTEKAWAKQTKDAIAVCDAAEKQAVKACNATIAEEKSTSLDDTCATERRGCNFVNAQGRRIGMPSRNECAPKFKVCMGPVYAEAATCRKAAMSESASCRREVTSRNTRRKIEAEAVEKGLSSADVCLNTCRAEGTSARKDCLSLAKQTTQGCRALQASAVTECGIEYRRCKDRNRLAMVSEYFSGRDCEAEQSACRSSARDDLESCQASAREECATPASVEEECVAACSDEPRSIEDPARSSNDSEAARANEDG